MYCSKAKSQCSPGSVTFISIEHELWLGLKATTHEGEVHSSGKRIAD